MSNRLGLGVLTFFALGVGVVAPLPWLLGVIAGLSEKPPLVAHLLDVSIDHRVVFLVHVIGGAIALIASPWQLMARLRVARPRLHRGTGYLYVTAVAASGIAGLSMGPRAWGGVVAQAGFTLLAIAWLLTTAIAVQRIRAGDREGHRVWMTRSFAVTFAAVSLRLQTPLLDMLPGSPEIAYSLIAWSCWVPNLALVELVAWSRARRRPKVTPAQTAGTPLESTPSSA